MVPKTMAGAVRKAEGDHPLIVTAFFVPGVPVAQGSSRAFLVPGRDGDRPRAVVTAANRAELRSWRYLVASAAAGLFLRPLDGPVELVLEFHLPIPKTRHRTLRTERQIAEWARPVRKPDLDKLVRAALDALTGVAFRDDAQVVALDARKEYADTPGLRVFVERAQRCGGAG